VIDLECFLVGLNSFGLAGIAIEFGLVELMIVAVRLIDSGKFELAPAGLAAIECLALVVVVVLVVIDSADFVERHLDFSAAVFGIGFVVAVEDMFADLAGFVDFEEPATVAVATGVPAIVVADFVLGLAAAVLAVSGSFGFDSARLARLGLAVLAATDSVVPDSFVPAVLVGFAGIEWFPAGWKAGMLVLVADLDTIGPVAGFGTDCNLVELYLEAVVT
jgi:hypothetical protein